MQTLRLDYLPVDAGMRKDLEAFVLPEENSHRSFGAEGC